MNALYPASLINPAPRRRATSAEMEIRARFLIDYAEAHGPVTVRKFVVKPATFK